MADLANNAFLTGRNQANSADLSIVRITDTDQIEMRSEDTNSTDPAVQTRMIVLQSGASTANKTEAGGIASGPLVVQSGLTKNSASGNITIQSGDSEYQSGDVFVRSGNGILEDEGWSGNLYLQTGGSIGDAAQCGDVVLAAGQNQDDSAKNGKILAESQFRLMLSSSDPSNPVQGCMYFNTSSSKVKVYDGSQWKVLAFE